MMHSFEAFLAWNRANQGAIQALASVMAAMIASIALIVTVTYYVRNLTLTRLSNSSKMTMDLVNRFESAEMTRARARFAQQLLGDPARIDVRTDSPVLDLFEEVAYLTRRRVLDEGMVWNSFSWWLEPYYEAAKPAIAQANKGYKVAALYGDTAWLYERMRLVSRRREGKGYSHPLNRRGFLEDEVRRNNPGVAIPSLIRQGPEPAGRVDPRNTTATGLVLATVSGLALVALAVWRNARTNAVQ
jgi:hypothetical protein